MLFSLLAVCKTCSLQSYKYSFKSKEGIVANIQYDVPSLKTLRREKTFFLFSSSLQGSLPKMRKHHNNNKAPAVSPDICGQFQHCKINSPCFTQIRMQQGRDYISVIWTDKTAALPVISPSGLGWSKEIQSGAQSISPTHKSDSFS